MYVSQLQFSRAKYEANELIKTYDKNGDGVLTNEELVDFVTHATRGSTQLNNQGIVPKISKVNDEVAYKLRSTADIKPNKQLGSKAKISSAWIHHTKVSNIPLSRKQMKEIFKYHDSDSDGFLNVRELTKSFAFLGSINPFYKAHYSLAHVDANKDGLISEDELDKLIDYANKFIRKK